MEQGLFIRELASILNVREDTITDWEKERRVPQTRRVRERLAQEIEGVGRFLT